MIRRSKPIQRKVPLKRSQGRIPARRGAPRLGPAGIPPDQWRNADYRRFLREEGVCLACCAQRSTYAFHHPREFSPSLPKGNCDPMHGPPLGVRMKGPDAGCIPGCRIHHEEQTKIGWPAFEAKYGFSREKEAASWWTLFLIWKEAQ